MTDDSAFLAHLSEHPGDDVTRLVYADWLEDRGDARGEYLRREVEFAALDEDSARALELAARLWEARRDMDRAWLRQAGKRFDVWLVSCPFPLKIRTIKVILECTGMRLANANLLSDSLPARVLDNLTLGEAEALRARFLHSAGRPLTTPPADLVVSVRPAANPAPRPADQARIGDSEGQFEVVLRSCPPAHLQELALNLRYLFLLDSHEANRVRESFLPCVVASGVDHYMAEALRYACEGVADVEVRQLS
jgi:uncharacterized protein (TIGR02996 family)